LRSRPRFSHREVTFTEVEFREKSREMRFEEALKVFYKLSLAEEASATEQLSEGFRNYREELVDYVVDGRSVELSSSSRDSEATIIPYDTHEGWEFRLLNDARENSFFRAHPTYSSLTFLSP